MIWIWNLLSTCKHAWLHTCAYRLCILTCVKRDHSSTCPNCHLHTDPTHTRCSPSLLDNERLILMRLEFLHSTSFLQVFWVWIYNFLTRWKKKTKNTTFCFLTLISEAKEIGVWDLECRKTFLVDCSTWSLHWIDVRTCTVYSGLNI